MLILSGLSIQTIGKETTDLQETTTSLYIHSDEPCFWYVIKARFSTPTTLTIREKHYQKWSNETKHVPIIFDGVLDYDPKTYHCGGGVGYAGKYPNLDRYIQLDIGLFNFTYKDNSSNNCPFTHETNSTWIMYNESGTMYYIFMNFAVEGEYNYWFNTSEPVEILATAEGDDTFFYHREDFHGKINFGNDKTTCIIDGKLKMNIEDNLFCWFYQLTQTIYPPFEKWKGFGKTCLSGNGREFEKIIQTLFPSLPTELVTTNYPNHDFFYGFPNGEYTFQTSCLFRSNYTYADTMLFGADIILP